MMENIETIEGSSLLPCHQSLVSTFLRVNNTISKEDIQSLALRLTENDTQRVKEVNSRVAAYMQSALMYCTHTEKVCGGIISH